MNLRYCLAFAVLLHVTHYAVVMATNPSPYLLNRAYCACKCCDERPDMCHMHDSIRNLECGPDQCTEKLCRLWKDAKCKTSCFCQKCQGTLSSTDKYKCALYNGVPDGCSCPEPEVINCDVPEEFSGKPEDSPEVKETMEKFEKYKDSLHCLIPCYCHKCKDNLPEGYGTECAKAGEPKSGCDCSNVTCPTAKDINKFKDLLKETEEMDVEAVKLSLEATAKKTRQETEEFNERLKPLIETGQAQPISPAEYKQTKCKLQCLCDKCRSESPTFDQNCDKMVPTREEHCPECPNDLTCPESDEVSSCKMFCFCDVCKYDQRMPQMLLNKCEEIANSDLDTESCKCTENINCNILDQIDKAQRAILEEKAKQEKEEKKEAEEKKDKKGKIKQKTKMWDEL